MRAWVTASIALKSRRKETIWPTAARRSRKASSAAARSIFCRHALGSSASARVCSDHLINGFGCPSRGRLRAQGIAEGGEQRARYRIVGVAPFRMPLHAQEKPARPRHGDGFDGAVGGLGFGAEAG